MKKTAVIAIFDVGKTNKKLLLFDEDYNVVFETGNPLEETTDEDGFACENVHALTAWVKESFDVVINDERFDVKAVNFSGYGASFVYIGSVGDAIAPLYNYLKPFPEALKQQFYTAYGGETVLSKQTSSPVLGNLNSGMQLYRLKYEQPEKFNAIRYALHLPQYLSYVLTKQVATDITSIGCHTNLWHFQFNKYHAWVHKEEIDKKFNAIIPCTDTIGFNYNEITYRAGFGLHDSSAALIPYLAAFKEPFMLLSTGTWCITLNPFNHSQLSDYELYQDCLCYLTYEGKPVKASRLFAGYEHEEQVKRLAKHFDKPVNYYTTVNLDEQILNNIAVAKKKAQVNYKVMVQQSAFTTRDLNEFADYETAYHQLIADIMQQQIHATKLVLGATVIKSLFVDGGFSKNKIYMHLLSKAFPNIKIYAATVAQASALGAAMAIHNSWNKKQIPANIIDIKLYSLPDLAQA